MKKFTIYSRNTIFIFIIVSSFCVNFFSQIDSLHSSENAKISLFKGVDGPYIINDTLYRIHFNNILEKSINYKKDSILVNVDNEFKDQFYFYFSNETKIPKTTYELPEKLIAISDIEGNYNALVGLLFANKVIDKNNNWIFKNGHLVLNGDFFDRGKNVVPILWLIYKLEKQAEKANGMVHFILGNHEILNLQGDYRYNDLKYIKSAKIISSKSNTKEALKYLYSIDSELGNWLRKKNVIEKIGGYLFVHGGLSPDILNYNISLKNINDIAREKIKTKKREETETSRFIFSSKGPLWYRGLVMDWNYYKKIYDKELDKILNNFNSKKIVIGHTFVKNVSYDFDEKIIRLDVKHDTLKFSNKTQALLIENGKEYLITSDYRKISLK